MNCWEREIEQSRTEAEVIHTARDFLSLWSPDELAPVSMGWRPLKIETGADIQRMKKWVVDDLGSDPAASHLGELADYLWLAASRLHEIRGLTR
jgi:hypothetical protein